MKSVKIMFIICTQLVLITNSCKKDSGYYDFRLKVINKSDMTINANFDQSYPDTTLGFYSPFYKGAENAATNETITLVRGGTWENAFKDVINQKLMVFVFDASIVEKTPWDTISKKYLILKRYELSLEDLQKLKWTITYP